ncbi:bifunctional phosphoribosyl-AMP cyclohydrolase/phosphoribosyl-ATP diphosphatase HisIE [Legionella londiniensis]|uniref:Histidine biosynthesis bifunctional protein HisIE n=1 Tax=Legionella londiniensis TaxID=45068 RepID=A0A0W0VS04_9GAMM|nr:bifunctional phosphoribosyl-AMP cyclohydrolase/phosphoribosyl-ATP diphosphatase HisIE [Legionella londiniensis]KTD22569.1 bifunctional phosphoribosyl-AMP cyclohydrolase/phosphoribosyl-ATP pyrophosphatase protein [Legionella londiniensis]STX92500.1 phosphoribosyl-ATP pyrophosphohydrolase [Legionella londiniensis]
MSEFNPPIIDWEKAGSLLPAVIQDHYTRQVLMMGYMNREALARTCETGRVTFYSRTRQRLWMKGETSGHVLKVVDILSDCDHDALLILAKIEGHCCHLKQPSCFGRDGSFVPVLEKLEEVIVSRCRASERRSYTAQLFAEGLQRIAQKVGEEGVEVALAAVAGNREETISEAADLLYHLLVLLAAKEIAFREVLSSLLRRKKP